MVLSCDMYVLLLVFHYYIVILYERNYILIYRGGWRKKSSCIVKNIEFIVGPPPQKIGPPL